MKKEETG